MIAVQSADLEGLSVKLGLRLFRMTRGKRPRDGRFDGGPDMICPDLRWRPRGMVAPAFPSWGALMTLGACT